MGRFLTPDDFIAQFGEDEARLVAGSGAFNSLEGSLIDPVLIEMEIAFVDELIGGYVLARHAWLDTQSVGDIPKPAEGVGRRHCAVPVARQTGQQGPGLGDC